MCDFGDHDTFGIDRQTASRSLQLLLYVVNDNGVAAKALFCSAAVLALAAAKMDGRQIWWILGPTTATVTPDSDLWGAVQDDFGNSPLLVIYFKGNLLALQPFYCPLKPVWGFSTYSHVSIQRGESERVAHNSEMSAAGSCCPPALRTVCNRDSWGARNTDLTAWPISGLRRLCGRRCCDFDRCQRQRAVLIFN